MSYIEIKQCRSCGSDRLQVAFSLGMQHVKDFLEDESGDSPIAPLELVFCLNCNLLQLKHTFSQARLYSKYWYKSGTSPTMIRALADIVQTAVKSVGLSTGDIVLDIGSNDGTLLRQYDIRGIIKVGFEPSNLWKEGVEKDTTILNNYFNAEQFNQTFGAKKAKIITSIAMFYDLEYPNPFVSDIRTCLHEKGLWIIQMNYLGLMLNNSGYDNICHEHLEYYSLISLEHLLNKHDLEVCDVELNNVNAGSFRLYIKHKNNAVQGMNDRKKRVQDLRLKELEKGFDTIVPYERFAVEISHNRQRMLAVINRLIKDGKTIFVYGASTRGLVILEYLGLTREQIPFATDKNRDKWGRIMAGTEIPIVSLERYRAMKPDYLLVLPYQYLNEIVNQEKDFLMQGGKLIIPLPRPRVIDSTYLLAIEDSDLTLFTEGYNHF